MANRPAAAPIAADEQEYEQWENTTAARICLKFYNQQGLLEDRLVGSRSKFQITPKERRLNQEQAADETYDPFENGRFAPVRLIESSSDAERIRSNPNILTEDDMRELIKTRRTPKAFSERVESVTNAHALARMLEIARDDDNATNKQVTILEQRLKTVAPSVYNEVATVGGPTTPSGPVAVTTADLGTR